MYKMMSLFIILLLIAGCSSSNQSNNNQNNNDEVQGEIPQEMMDHNEIAPQIDLKIHLLKRNEILLEVNHIGKDDFYQLNIYVTLYEENSNKAIEREYYFTAFSAGNLSYQFSTDLKEYTLDLDRTVIRYSYGNPYAIKQDDLSKFVSIEHAKNDKNNVIAIAKNESDKVIKYLSVYTIYYADNEIVGAHMRFASDLEPNEEVIFDFLAPIDVNNYMVMYDDYKIGVRSAYYPKP